MIARRVGVRPDALGDEHEQVETREPEDEPALSGRSRIPRPQREKRAGGERPCHEQQPGWGGAHRQLRGEVLLPVAWGTQIDVAEDIPVLLEARDASRVPREQDGERGGCVEREGGALRAVVRERGALVRLAPRTALRDALEPRVTPVEDHVAHEHHRPLLARGCWQRADRHPGALARGADGTERPERRPAEERRRGEREREDPELRQGSAWRRRCREDQYPSGSLTACLPYRPSWSGCLRPAQERWIARGPCRPGRADG